MASITSQIQTGVNETPLPMNGMITILIWATVAIGVSFLCSVIEAVMLSITDAQVAAISERKPKLGYKWEIYKNDISTPLFGVLTLNTISHTAGAGGVGAATLETYGNDAVAIASVILTLLILIFSELIPKTIGEKYAKQLAGPTAKAVSIITILTYPLVKPINMIRNLFPEDETSPVDKDDVNGLIGIAGDSGIIRTQTESALKNVLRFAEMEICDIMTPIEIVETIKAKEALKPSKRKYRFTKIPVSDMSACYVKSWDLKAANNTQYHHTISVNGREPAMNLDTHLKSFNLIFVHDDEGRRQGIVCREDVLDFLLASPTRG